MLTNCFRLHDFFSELVARNLFLIKRVMLIMAFSSLFFIFFPVFRKDFGNFAEGTLLFLLFLSPISKILRMRLLLQLMGLRREMGILMGCFALVHGLAYFIDPSSFLDITPYLNANFFSMQPLFYFGILALLFTLPLFFTSNNISLRFLGGENWKLVHRLVYGVFVTMLLHIFFVRNIRHGYNTLELIQPASIIFSYLLLKVLAWKNFIAPLQNVITSVAERYKEYTLAKKSSI